MIPIDRPKAQRVRLDRLRVGLLLFALAGSLLAAAYLVAVRGVDWVGLALIAATLAIAVAAIVVVFRLLGSTLERMSLAAEDAARQNQHLAALQRVGQALSSTLDLDALLALVVREAVTVNDALCGQVLLVEPDGGLRVAARHRVVGEPRLPGKLVQRAARDGQSHALDDVTREADYTPLDTLARSAVAVPIHSGDSVTGVLYLESARAGAFSAGGAALLTELPELVAVALNNARTTASLERQLTESSLLAEVARTVNASDNLTDALQATVAMLASTLGYKRVAFYLREGDVLLQAAQIGYDPARCLQRQSITQGIVGRAARLGTTQFVPDVTADPDYLSAADDVRSEIAVPLVHEGQVVGVVNVEATVARPLTSEDVALLSHVAPQISVAIENARLHTDQAQRLRVLAALHEHALDLMAELDLGRLMHTLAERAAQLTGASSAIVYVYRAEQRVLELGAFHNVPAQLPAAHVRSGDGVAGQVVQLGRSLLVDDYSRWPGRASAFVDAGWSACAGVPMRSRGEVIGVISVANLAAQPRFSQETLQLLELFAGQAAAAIVNAQLYMAEQQRRRTSEALREVGRVVSSSLNLDEVLALILQQLERVLPYDNSTIMLWDGRQLRVRACRGFDMPEAVVGTAYTLEDGGLLLEVLNSRQPRVISDVRAEPRWPRRKTDTAELRTLRAWIGVPMIAQDRSLGLLTVDSQESNFYRAEEGQIAQVFAEQAAIAIHNARLYAESEAKLSELTVLYDVALATTSAESADQVLERAVDRLREGLGVSHVAILLLDQDQQALRVRAASGFPGDVAERLQLRVGEGVAGIVAQSGRPLLVPDVRADPRYVSFDPEVRSALCVPLALGSQIIGVLEALSVAPGAFREADLRLLSTLGGQLSAIISNAQLLDVLVASQQQLAERNRALQEANLRLQELDRLKSQFLANMSHELRTPLNSIIGFAEVLADGLAGALNPEQHEYVGYIHSSGHHLLNLINDVLDLSKIDAGKMKLEVRAFHLADVVTQVQATFAPLLGRRRQTFIVDLSPDVPTINGDAFRIKQVLINLMSNAHKYTPDGGTITLSARLRDPDSVLLSVTDTGLGIKPEYHQVIFEEFRQADSGLTREYEGTGLGLAICRRLVELHGGQIWVESEYGRGASFCFVLPVVGPGGIARRGEAPTRTVLIVEDDKQFAHLLSLHMRQAGYEPIAVNTGADALPQAQRLHPALITLDIMLPDLSGWAVLQALKSDPLVRDVPVLVISVIEDPERARSLGAVDYLIKPLDRNALIAVLNRLKLVEEISSRPLDVLLIDSDAGIGRVIGAMLPQGQYAMRQALSADEALRGIEERWPQLVILNLVLPNGDGMRILEMMRGSDSRPDVPVIVLSDEVLPETERIQLSDQMRAFIAKSTFTRDQLLAEVRRLEHYHHRGGTAHGPVGVS